jgi:hypothetical protein
VNLQFGALAEGHLSSTAALPIRPLVKPKQHFDGNPAGYGTMGGVASGIEASAANRLQAALVQTHANPLGQVNLGGTSICSYEHFECDTSLHF